MNKNLWLLSIASCGIVIGCQNQTGEKGKGTDEASQQVQTPVEEKKPNIIYIMADDLGYADVGCFGQEKIQTPNIDKMAENGMKLTQHYAGNTVSAPSRCALMTGMHMGHAQVRGNKQHEPSGQYPISDQTITVAEMLKKAGYVTAMIGKWGLGIENTEGEPNKQGFDMYYGYLDQVLAHNYYPEYLLRNGEKEMLKNEVKYLDSTEWHKGLGSYATEKVDYSHDLFTKEALQFIENNKDTSFFLYLPYTIPHDNGEAPDNQKQEVPDYGMYANEDWPDDTKGYAAMITRMDKDIGVIMQKISEYGIDENTLIIFTSDNGPMPNVDFTKFFDSNGELKGGKRYLYEGGIRVPFVACWKGKIQAGTTSDHISAFWDFMPTACELAGIEPPKTDGISYLPTLLGQEQKAHDYLYWEFPEKGYSIAIRSGKWKAVKNKVKENPDTPWELYNLETDIGEENNIAEQHPEIVATMDSLFQTARTKSDVFPMPGE